MKSPGLLKAKMISSFCILHFFFVSAQDNSSPKPVLEYLSGLNNVRDFTISEDQQEAYFTIQSPNDELAVMVRITKENGIWSQPNLVSFSGKYRDIEPFLTADGLRLYFSSNRPLNDLTSPAKDYDIWYVERADLKSNWLAPVNLGKPVNTSSNEFFPSLAQNGNLYFTSDAVALIKKDDIFFSKWNGQSYTDPVPLDENVNSEGYEFNAYIAPDESFLIYTAYGRKDGVGSGDLYISRRDATGKWNKAVNMGTKINSSNMDYCPFVDIKTNTLYFTSKRNAVSQQNFTSVNDFLEEISQYENGLSRIYQVLLK